MADFRTHLTVSSSLGIAYGGAAYLLFDVPASTSLLAGGLCAVSGMLPDVDSDSSKPLRESLAFAAAIVPMMLVDRFHQLGMSSEWMVISGVAAYLFVRFVFGHWLRSYTVHRGMFHSLPAAAIMGELAFLLASGDVAMRYYKAGGLVAGYLSHLLLDELYSIEWKRGRMRLKKSFGTALKMYSKNKFWPNVSTYLKLAALSYVVFYEPGWSQQYRDTRAQSFREEQQHQRSHTADPVEQAVIEKIEKVAEATDRFFR